MTCAKCNCETDHGEILCGHCECDERNAARRALAPATGSADKRPYFGSDVMPPQLTKNIVACPWCGKSVTPNEANKESEESWWDIRWKSHSHIFFGRHDKAVFHAERAHGSHHDSEYLGIFPAYTPYNLVTIATEAKMPNDKLTDGGPKTL